MLANEGFDGHDILAYRGHCLHAGPKDIYFRNHGCLSFLSFSHLHCISRSWRAHLDNCYFFCFLTRDRRDNIRLYTQTVALVHLCNIIYPVYEDINPRKQRNGRAQLRRGTGRVPHVVERILAGSLWRTPLGNITCKHDTYSM